MFIFKNYSLFKFDTSSRKIKTKGIKLALNSVGGKSSLFLAAHLENNGVMVTYGGMSKQPVQV